jgi:CRISPR/Cas system-associated endonuclease/helicase Cas3
MDLATLDSMIQRLGRVNRAGLGAAQVHIVHTAKESERPAPSETSKAKPKSGPSRLSRAPRLGGTPRLQGPARPA